MIEIRKRKKKRGKQLQQENKDNQTICPACHREALKVIHFGFPIYLCVNDGCNTVWGFWSRISVRMEMFFGFLNQSGGFNFMVYSGSYWKALWVWLFQTGKIKGEE